MWHGNWYHSVKRECDKGGKTKMVFSSAIFLFLFFPSVLLCYFCAKSIEAKNNVLLIFSILFYAWGEPVYVLLLAASIIANWKFGLLVSRGEDHMKKSGWLWLAR